MFSLTYFKLKNFMQIKVSNFGYVIQFIKGDLTTLSYNNNVYEDDQ